MGKKQNKKGKKAPLSPYKPSRTRFGYYNERTIDPSLIKYLEGLDWIPKRCFLAYDFEHDRICVIMPDLMMEEEMFRYFEFPMMSEGVRLVYGKEVQAILKKAKKVGKRRRLL